jgi:predicted PurR-regulated permease PerM
VSAALAALTCVLGLIAAGVLAGWFIVPSIVDEFRSLGPTIAEGVDDVERWLIDDAPFDLTRRDLEDLRKRAGDAIEGTLRSSTGSIIGGALTVIQAMAGVLLGLITTFFFLRDGPRFQRWTLARVPEPRRELVGRLSARAWSTLGGYLLGAAVLGSVEAVIIGVALAVVGGSLVLPVALLTFVAAFVPFVGAIFAGLVAVLVALATAGPGGALVVAIVALVVQQLDNDLLAPVVYGQALQLHPLVVLFAIVCGGAMFGFAGTVLAVPVAALAVNLTAEARER